MVHSSSFGTDLAQWDWSISICHRTYFHTSKDHVTWIIKKVNRISTHCDVAYENVRSLGRGCVIRVWFELFCEWEWKHMPGNSKFVYCPNWLTFTDFSAWNNLRTWHNILAEYISGNCMWHTFNTETGRLVYCLALTKNYCKHVNKTNSGKLKQVSF